MMEGAYCTCGHEFEQHAGEGACCSPGCMCCSFNYDTDGSNEELEEAQSPGPQQ